MFTVPALACYRYMFVNLCLLWRAFFRLLRIESSVSTRIPSEVYDTSLLLRVCSMLESDAAGRYIAGDIVEDRY